MLPDCQQSDCHQFGHLHHCADADADRRDVRAAAVLHHHLHCRFRHFPAVGLHWLPFQLPHLDASRLYPVWHYYWHGVAAAPGAIVVWLGICPASQHDQPYILGRSDCHQTAK